MRRRDPETITTGAVMTIANSHAAAFDHDEFRRAIGDELRAIRRGRLNWSRAKQLSQMRDVSDIGSTQTLTTYELGTREISLIRFVELCRVMGVRASDVLASVESEVLDAVDTPIRLTRVEVDLRVLSRLPEGPLTPLMKWACAELWSGRALESPIRPLSADALDTMATLCGLDAGALLTEIRKIHKREGVEE
jgi:hypothetical protein